MLHTDSNEFYRMYWDEKKSAARIAIQFGVTHQAVLRQMKKLGIPRRSYSKANSWVYKSEPPVTAHGLRQLYVSDKKSTRQIARELGIAQSSVRRWMKRLHIPARRGGSPLKYPRKPFSGDEKEKAYLLAMRAGDISACQRTPHTIEVATASSHPAMIDLFYDIFGKYGHCGRWPRSSNLGYEWALYCGLDISFTFLVCKPPEAPVEGEFFYPFLAGYIDAEGCWKISATHRKWISFGLVINSEDLGMLSSIQKKLREDGYHTSLCINNRKSRFHDAGPLYQLSVNRRKEVISIIQRTIQLLKHKEKIEKARLILEIKNEKAWANVRDKIKTFKERVKRDVDKCVKEAKKLHEFKHKIPNRTTSMSGNSEAFRKLAPLE